MASKLKAMDYSLKRQSLCAHAHTGANLGLLEGMGEGLIQGTNLLGGDLLCMLEPGGLPFQEFFKKIDA